MMTITDERGFTDQRGFTVAEVLIAAVIITVAFVALATIVPISTYGVQEGNQVTTASFLADQKLEQIKNLPWIESPAKDCLGISASSTEAPTVPAGASCTLGATTVAAGGALTWVADESSTAITGFSGYSRNVRITNCGTLPGCFTPTITDSALRLVTVTVTYTPLNAAPGVGTTGPKSLQVQMVVSQR
jgi:prepilin-type N-terminal cleavage/methylation domain-containing protein